MEPKTLQYFSQNLSSLCFELFQVLDNPDHPEYNNLLHDMRSINDEELPLYVSGNDIDSGIRDSSNIDLDNKAHFLINRLCNDIAIKRLKTLCSDDVRLKPYNSFNLKEILVNEDNLVDASIFQLNPNGGIVYENYGYRLCPSTILENSTYWLLLEIIKLVNKSNKKFFIRLDPFIEIPINDYAPMEHRMVIYGKPLNWERIGKMRSDDFGQFINDEDDSEYSITDYIWHVEENEIHFTCEELPSNNKCEARGSRYFHAIFNKTTGNIIHCDGAIRIYNELELRNRKTLHIRNSDARKVGKRIKIFQTNDSLNPQEFSNLVVKFFVWNQDVESYFNNIL